MIRSNIRIILFVAFGWLLLTPGTLPGAEGPDRPNIILFVSDDHGWRHSGAYGHDLVKTPNIDRLAMQGMRFTHAFAASPLCSPSRCVIETGLMPHRNGAHLFGTPIHTYIKTMPQYLNNLGYHTAHFGKFHHAPGEQFPYDTVSDDVSRGVEFLSNDTGQSPLFMVICSHQPHTPWDETNLYDPGDITLPPDFVKTPQTRQDRARYLGEVTVMDRQLGRVLDALDEAGMRDDTLFVYTTDQGANWPFAKWTLYEAGLRVPFVARWPGRIEAGTTSSAMINLVDLLPTVLDAANAQGPTGIDGRSILPVLRGKRDAHRKMVFGTHTGNENGPPVVDNEFPARTVRNRNYRYIFNLYPERPFQTHITGTESGPHYLAFWDTWVEKARTNDRAKKIVEKYRERPREELYNLRKDPYQMNNLADDPAYAKKKEQLKQKLIQFCRQQGDTEALKLLMRTN